MAINFEIGLRLTDKELKSQLASVQKDLTKAFTVRTSEGGFSKEIAAAATQAKALENALKQATTTKGISYAQLNTELAKAGTTAGKLTTTLAEGGKYFNASLNSANNALALSNRQVFSLNRTLQEAARVFKQSFKFTVAQTAIRAISTEIREAVQWVTSLNDAVNEIAVVTGKTANQITKVTDQAIKGSKELRIAAEDYARGALIFYQQGLNDEEVIRRNEITIKAAKAANQSIDDMSKQLTAIWNTYGMVGDEQLRAASVGAKMAAQTAVDFSDIAQAMQTAAAPAAQMGVEYNQLAAIIATVGDVTQQSASIIGNAYKTIFSRFQQLVSDGTDGEVTLGRVSEQLQNLGVQLLDSDGNLKNLGQTINEVGKNWDSWSEEQQLAIAQLVGGTRQYGQFLALMQNFDKYQKNLAGAATEDGSTLEQQYTQAIDSIESRAENAAEAWHRAFGEVINADQIKTVYTWIEKIGEAVGGVLKSLGGAPGIVSMLVTMFAGKLVPAIMQTGNSLKTMYQNLTPQGRQKSINKDFDDNKTSIQGSSKLNDEQKSIALSKNEFSRQTALINEQINTQLEKATGAYRTQLQMAQQLLKEAQEQYQVALDDEQAQKRAIENRERALRVLQSTLKTQQMIAEAEYQEALNDHQQATTNVQSALTEAQLADEGVVQASLKVKYEEDNLQAAQNLGDENLIAEATQNLKYAREDLAKATQKATAAQEKLNQAKTNEEQAESRINEARNNADLAAKAVKIGDVAKAYNDMAKAVASYDVSERTVDDFKDLKLSMDEVIQEMKQIPDVTDETVQELENLGEALANVDDDSDLDDILEQIMHLRQALSEGFDIDTEEADNLLGDHGDITSSRRRQDNAGDAGAGDGGDEDRAKATLTEVLTLTTQVTAGIFAITNAWNSLTDIWLDTDTSMFEKVAMSLTTISGLLIALGPLITMVGQSGFLAGLKTQAGFAPFLPILYAIAAIIGVVIAAFAAWDLVIKANIKNAEQEVEKCQEQIDATNELTDAINQNTKSLQDNVAAYQDAIANGGDVTATYKDMVAALKQLNDSLAEAGASQEELHRAMTQVLSTGDMEKYYDLQREASLQLYEQQMKQYEKLNQAQVKLSQANMTKFLDFDGPKKTTIATTTSYSDGAGNVYTLEPSKALKDIAAESDLFSEKGGTITLNLEFDNASDFRKQYKDLVKTRNELEKMGGTEAELAKIDEQIEGMTEQFDALEESVATARAAMEDMVAQSIAFQTSKDGGGLDLDGMSFGDQSAYLSSIFEMMKQQGLAVGMTMEEIESSFRGVVGQVPQLNDALASLDQVGQITENVLNNQSGGFGTAEATKRIDELKAHYADLQKVVDDASKKTGIGKWFNGLSAEEEYFIDTLGRTKEEVATEMEAIQKEITDAQVDVEKAVAEKYNSLTGEERKLLLKTGVDFVDDEEDIQAILDNMDDLKARVSIEFKNENELQAQIASDNSLQEGLEPAIKEFKDTGMVSVDTAKEMIDSGLAEYLMVVNDHFVLTEGSANAYNASLEREKDNVQALLEVSTELRGPAMELAETMAVLRATMDNSALEQYASGLEEVAITFLNSEGNAQDMITYFQGMETAVASSLENIKGEISNLTDGQLQQLLNTFETIGTNLADVMKKADNAVAQGQITIGEYRDALMAAGEAQKQSSMAALSVAEEKVSDTIKDVNEQLGLTGDAYLSTASDLKKYIAQQKSSGKLTEDEIDDMNDLSDALSDAEGNYDDIANSVKDFDEAMSDMEAMESFTDKVSENFEELQGILDNDFSLKFDLEDLDTSQIETLTSVVQSAMDSIAGLSEEALGRVADNLTTIMGETETFMINGTNYTGEQLAIALKNHEITAEQVMAQGGAAAEAILQATAMENENTIRTAGQAIGGLMTAVGNLIKDFEAHINVTIEKADLDLIPSWSGPLDLGAKLLAGKKVSIKPKGSIDFSISGGLTGDSAAGFQSALDSAAQYFNTSGGGGLTDGMPDLGDYAQREFEPAKPGDFQTPDGTDKNNKSGGKDYKNDAKEKDAEKPEERYENIDSAIASLTTTIEKLNDAEEDAWGKTKIRNLKALNIEIAKQNSLLTSRLKEAKAYYDSDWYNVVTDKGINAAGFDISNITRNKDGSINNIEQIKEQLWLTHVKPYIDAENALIGSTNEELVKAAQKATEDANKVYEESLKMLEKLQDSVEQYKDTLQRIVDNIRGMMSNIVAEMEYRLEFRIGIRERDLKRLEKLADRWGDIGVLNGEADKSLQRQWPKILQKMDNTVAEFDYAVAHIKMLEQAKEGGKDSAAYKQIMDYMTHDMPAEQAEYFQKAFDEYLAGNGALPAEFADMLMDMRDNLEEYFDEAVDNQLQQLDNIFTRINDWLDKTFAHWDDTLDFNDAIMNWSDALLEYTGAYSANDLSMQEGVRLQNRALLDQGQARLDSAIAKHDAYGVAISEAEDTLEYIRKNLKESGKGLSRTAQEWGDYADELEASGDTVGAAAARMFANFGAGAEAALQTQISEWREAQSEMMTEIVDSQTELLQIAQENIEREKELAKKNVGTILNGMFTDLEDMAANYDTVKTEQDMTFDDYDQTYMTNKLQNMYDEFAENADVDRLENLAKWQEKLNKYKEEMVTIDENGNEIITHRLSMSQNEYDLLQKEFELEQLRAQFEDARNNKNTMRLARDASGNYSYVYSSDAAANDGSDNAQSLADKEYEYKKMLESIQDETISTTTQIGIELQNTIDGINQYLWEHDEKYRESVKVKISSLYKQLQNYGVQAEQIFDGLAVGVGSFDSVWNGSAGQILTGATDIQTYIGDMAKAICGDGNMTTPDKTSYLGRILSAQAYWGQEANQALKDSMAQMADSEAKDSIPSSFGDIGEKVLSIINEQIGNPELAGSAYGNFKANTKEIQKQIHELLNGSKDSIWSSYDTLGKVTAEQLGAVGEDHNDILFAKIKEYIGTPGDDSETTVLGRIKMLQDEMYNLKDATGQTLTGITDQFKTWREQVMPEIQSVIDKIKEAIGLADQYQNQQEPGDPTDPPFTYNPDDDLGTTIDPGIVTPTTPGPVPTPTTPAPQPTSNLSEGDIRGWAFSGANKMAAWAFSPNSRTYKAIQEKTGADFDKVVAYAKTDAYAQAVGYTNATFKTQIKNKMGWASVMGQYGKSYNDWRTLIADYPKGFDTGGYTGDFGSKEGKLAILHEKELVLNAEDTKNILAAVAMMRQTVAGQLGSLNTSLATSTGSLASLAAQTPAQSPQAVDQQVKIEASFPGVSVAQEVEDALNSLITQAAQYNIKR